MVGVSIQILHLRQFTVSFILGHFGGKQGERITHVDHLIRDPLPLPVLWKSSHKDLLRPDLV